MLITANKRQPGIFFEKKIKCDEFVLSSKDNKLIGPCVYLQTVIIAKGNTNHLIIKHLKNYLKNCVKHLKVSKKSLTLQS